MSTMIDTEILNNDRLTFIFQDNEQADIQKSNSMCEIFEKIELLNSNGIVNLENYNIKSFKLIKSFFESEQKEELKFNDFLEMLDLINFLKIREDDTCTDKIAKLYKNIALALNENIISHKLSFRSTREFELTKERIRNL